MCKRRAGCLWPPCASLSAPRCWGPGPRAGLSRCCSGGARGDRPAGAHCVAVKFGLQARFGRRISFSQQLHLSYSFLQRYFEGFERQNRVSINKDRNGLPKPVQERAKPSNIWKECLLLLETINTVCQCQRGQEIQTETASCYKLVTRPDLVKIHSSTPS